MSKRDHTLTYTFRGSAKQLNKLQKLINIALQEEAAPSVDHQGPVENWGQSGGWVQDLEGGWSQNGGWYLVIENDEVIKVSQPDSSLTKVTMTVYEALSKAEKQG